MDSSVIEEIAKQLGLAVDQAGMFITEQLPNFAALKVMQSSCAVGISAFLLLAIIPIFIWSLRAVMNIQKENQDRYYHLDDYAEGWVCIVSFCMLVLFAVIFIVILCFCLPEIVGWANYPEAMLIDMALKAV